MSGRSNNQIWLGEAMRLSALSPGFRARKMCRNGAAEALDATPHPNGLHFLGGFEGPSSSDELIAEYIRVYELEWYPPRRGLPGRGKLWGTGPGGGNICFFVVMCFRGGPIPHKARVLWPKRSLWPFWGGESRILGSGPRFCVQLLFFWHSGGFYVR